MLTALACQETGDVWPILRGKDMTVAEILALCVGDTLDEDKGRKAFPRNRAQLEAAPKGPAMFKVARDALLAMAKHVPGFGFAKKRPDKFCHGFGLFQRDLQFFKTDPDYFLNCDWATLEGTLAHCLTELRRGLKKLDFAVGP
jgi:hypothetical protein